MSFTHPLLVPLLVPSLFYLLTRLKGSFWILAGAAALQGPKGSLSKSPLNTYFDRCSADLFLIQTLASSDAVYEDTTLLGLGLYLAQCMLLSVAPALWVWGLYLALCMPLSVAPVHWVWGLYLALCMLLSVAPALWCSSCALGLGAQLHKAHLFVLLVLSLYDPVIPLDFKANEPATTHRTHYNTATHGMVKFLRKTSSFKLTKGTPQQVLTNSFVISKLPAKTRYPGQ
ncbi:hypothetical protein BDR05DRAFT_949557 [Suillus weaverae]|nr:hypothetical protein BDR05DRAFT_949557 [Suillus weaverae]